MRMMIMVVCLLVLNGFAPFVEAQVAVETSIGYAGVSNRWHSRVPANGAMVDILIAPEMAERFHIAFRHENVWSRLNGYSFSRMKYSEVTANVGVPWLAQHYAIVGVAGISKKDEFYGPGYSKTRLRRIHSPVLGVGGVQSIGDTHFGYSWRALVNGARSDRFSSVEWTNRRNPPSQIGQELRGYVSQALKPGKMAIWGEYVWRRLGVGDIDHGPRIGMTYAFVR